jgi:bacteriocin-like protein
VFSNDVLSKKELKTVQGGMLTAAMKNGAPTINGAGLVATDIDASNGVIHVIDSVMLPPATTAKTSHVAPAKVQYVAHVCPTSGRVTYSVAQSNCRP